MRYALILSLTLAAYWWVLSGYALPLILAFGLISILVVVGLAARMKILDFETAPYLAVPATLVYFGWLFKEIVKANVQVVNAVIDPDLEVSPTLVKIPAPGKSDLSKTMFANSITLTPGTVSVDLGDDHILVHALLSEMSDPDDFAEMSDRSSWAVGR